MKRSWLRYWLARIFMWSEWRYLTGTRSWSSLTIRDVAINYARGHHTYTIIWDPPTKQDRDRERVKEIR